jgi:superoxide reductase
VSFTPKFFICGTCGNIVGLIKSGGGELVCCGSPMKELKANTEDASQEKHVPDVTIDGDTLIAKVGSVAHPMVDEHYIEWIYVVTDKKSHRAWLKPGEAPEATFCLEGEKPIAVYEYCNLHGLWVKEL